MNPRERLKEIAEQVKGWPPYMRVHSSAYYEAKRRKRRVTK